MGAAQSKGRVFQGKLSMPVWVVLSAGGGDNVGQVGYGGIARDLRDKHRHTRETNVLGSF